MLVLIAAEMVGSKAGLGYFITYAQYNFLIPEMYAGILTKDNIEKAEKLAGIAQELGYSAAQLAIAWILREPNVASA